MPSLFFFLKGSLSRPGKTPFCTWLSEVNSN